ncbi:CC0125/CC1285 family lipoprotein [Colwellia piezophila]|uniref:CC0125/CC1285 family lipoprotein n=1 Tax=Colwellia piezophila TaxID=211668 RepID=UPI00037D65FC|nr:hypothetical protein [Colwellia piezophila]
MDLKKVIILICIMFLSGCAYQPTPYKVVQSVEYVKGGLAGQYKLGVTEQRISDNRYVLTVKLDSGSSVVRAQKMLMLHAATMAINNGYDSFTGGKNKTGKWCQGSSNRSTGQRSINDGGPTVTVTVTFVDSKGQTNKKKKRKIKNAAKVIEKFSSEVNQIISSEQANSNTDTMLKSCWDSRY